MNESQINSDKLEEWWKVHIRLLAQKMKVDGALRLNIEITPRDTYKYQLDPVEVGSTVADVTEKPVSNLEPRVPCAELEHLAQTWRDHAIVDHSGPTLLACALDLSRLADSWKPKPTPTAAPK